MADHDAGRTPRGLVRLFTILVLVTTATFVIFAVVLYGAYRETETQRERGLKLASLRGILELDEALTMSARMAAATGQKRWVDRYREQEPALARTIEGIGGLMTDAESRVALHRIRLANRTLQEIEREAIHLVLGNKPEQAWQMLQSEPYERGKTEYASALTELLDTLEREMDGAVRVQTVRFATAGVGSVLSLVAVLVSWATLTVILRRQERRSRRYATRLRSLLDERTALRSRATVDALTGAWNRATILELLDAEARRAEVAGQPFGVIMMDLDHFKRINDSMGHPAGDRVLREAVARIRHMLRPGDEIGRYGGEEFLVVVPGAGPEAVESAAERLRCALAADPISGPQGPIPVTISAGAASVVPGTSAEGAIKEADDALLAAKQRGRNCVVLAP